MIPTVEQIDHRIERLQAVMKRLRAERRLAVLREKHRRIKFNGTGSAIPKGAYL